MGFLVPPPPPFSPTCKHPHLLTLTSTPQPCRDYLGYYRLLGLDSVDSEQISQSDIKAAFREAALLWHPDQLSDSSDKERFLQLRKAYEVLRDPDLRSQYDRGELKSAFVY